MDRVHRFHVGETVRVGERSLISVAKTNLYSANGGCFGQADPHALVILDAEDLYFYPFVSGLTLEQLIHTVPELEDRIRMELERRDRERTPSSEQL